MSAKTRSTWFSQLALVDVKFRWDTDDDGTDDITLAYDAAGNLTDDGKDYKYVYDAFGRLRKVNNQSDVLVAEYTYNGLGYRTGWHSTP